MKSPSLPFPLNPDYGHGATRRRVRLWNDNGGVSAILSDIFHEMHCHIAHDGVNITGVEGTMLRVPTSSCAGAVAPLRELIGTPLRVSPREIYRGGRILQHCTHLFDLVVLAIGHASRGECGERLFDAIVPDTLDAVFEAEINLDGALVHRWTIEQGVIQAPAILYGKSLFKGFSTWSSKLFDGSEWDAAMILARTCMIAGGRAYLTDVWKGEPIARNNTIIGACYSYAPERLQEGVFLGDNVRDFSLEVVESKRPQRLIK